MLFITEVTSIVDKLERVLSFARVTKIGFQNLATFDESLNFVITLEAFEGCLFHLGNDIGVTNDNTL